MSKHPNIVSYIETYLWDDNIWLIMECMEGGCVCSFFTHRLLVSI